MTYLTRTGDVLRVIKHEELEHIGPGQYIVGLRGVPLRETHRVYKMKEDDFETGPCLLLARVDEPTFLTGVERPLPFGVHSARFRKGDGFRVVTDWVLERTLDRYRPPTRRDRLREWAHDTKESLRVLGLLGHVWHGYLYRPVSRLLHRVHLHHMPPNRIESSVQYWCRWCGLRVTMPVTSTRLIGELPKGFEWTQRTEDIDKRAKDLLDAVLPPAQKMVYHEDDGTKIVIYDEAGPAPTPEQMEGKAGISIRMLKAWDIKKDEHPSRWPGDARIGDTTERKP